MVMPAEEIITAKYAFAFPDHGIALSFVFVTVVDLDKEPSTNNNPETILGQPEIADFNRCLRKCPRCLFLYGCEMLV